MKNQLVLFLYFAVTILIDVISSQSVNLRNKNYELTEENIYKGCGERKGCIESEEGCMEKSNCRFVLTYEVKENFYRYEMIGKLAHNYGYVAFGLSNDELMGYDSVVECVSDMNNKTGVFLSYNDRFSDKNKMHERVVANETDSQCTYSDWNQTFQTDLKLAQCKVAIVNNKILCTFYRDIRIVYQKFVYDTSLYPFYILLVSGSSVFPNNIGKHDSVFVTKKKYDLSKPNQNEGIYPHHLTIHAILNLINWFFLVPTSVYISRYFKETYTHKGCCERRLWYLLHIGFSVVAFLFCSISIISILVQTYHKGLKWPSSIHQKLHAEFGGATYIVFFIVVTTGWFRARDRKSMKTLAFSHWLLGTLTYILALITLGLSYNMGMPFSIFIVLGVWLLWTVLWHLIMAYHYNWLDSSLGQTKFRAFSPLPISVLVQDEDAPGGYIRLRLLIIHGAGGIVLIIIMSILYLKQTSSQDY